MRIAHLLSASAFFVLAACGQAAAPSEAEAQTAAAISPADQAAMLGQSPNAQGQVENECGEMITPQFLNVDLGGDVGGGVLLVMTGGPNTAACYGDGPGLTLFKHEGASWRAIYFSRGASLAVLPTRTGGVSDLAEAGPGFEHPLWTWNGTEYASNNRTIPDAQMEGAAFLP